MRLVTARSDAARASSFAVSAGVSGTCAPRVRPNRAIVFEPGTTATWMLSSSPVWAFVRMAYAELASPHSRTGVKVVLSQCHRPSDERMAARRSGVRRVRSKCAKIALSMAATVPAFVAAINRRSTLSIAGGGGAHGAPCATNGAGSDSPATTPRSPVLDRTCARMRTPRRIRGEAGRMSMVPSRRWVDEYRTSWRTAHRRQRVLLVCHSFRREGCRGGERE
jgi:hypothetical protein